MGIIDVVKGLFDGLPESDHAVISQHQNLQYTKKQGWENNKTVASG